MPWPYRSGKYGHGKGRPMGPNEGVQISHPDHLNTVFYNWLFDKIVVGVEWHGMWYLESDLGNNWLLPNEMKFYVLIGKL